MTDHDAIAARVRQDMKAGTPGLWRVGPVDDTIVTAADGSEVAAVDGDYNEPDLWPIMEANARRIAALPDLEAAYLDLYDEVKRLRADLTDGSFYKETDIDRLQERAEKAEAERIAEWNKRRDAESSLVLEKAVCLTAEAERDRLRTALNEIASAADGIAHDLQIGPEDEGRDIYDMVLAIRDDAREALKGPEE